MHGDARPSVSFLSCYDVALPKSYVRATTPFNANSPVSKNGGGESEILLMPVRCLITSFFLFLMSDIKEDYDLSGYAPDFFFPVAACKITQCSTFAVVCRLKSRRHVVTSQESELVWPEFPLAKVTFPPNAVPKDESFEVTAKVLHARTVHVFTSSIFSSWNHKAFGTVGCWRNWQQKQ